jgi:acetolactate synthase-1/2/3 large subunit
MGLGAMPRSHRLCTGLIGMHGTVASNKAAQKADLLVAIGARFSDRVICRADMLAKNAKVLHFDIDPAEINKNIETHAWVLGDLKKTLGRLLKKLKPVMESGWLEEIGKWKRQTRKILRAASGKKGLDPRFVIEESARLLGPDTIAVTDVGQHQIWAAQFFPAERPRSFLSSGGLGSMGFGLGAALGASLANPGRPVLLFTGDGCFKMNSGELATVKAYGIPILILLFKNGVLGMVRQWQSFFYEDRYSETDLNPYPDFVKLSEAYGILGLRAKNRSSFASALDAARRELAAGRACLIEVNIDPDEKVLPISGLLPLPRESDRLA